MYEIGAWGRNATDGEEGLNWHFLRIFEYAFVNIYLCIIKPLPIALISLKLRMQHQRNTAKF